MRLYYQLNMFVCAAMLSIIMMPLRAQDWFTTELPQWKQSMFWNQAETCAFFASFAAEQFLSEYRDFNTEFLRSFKDYRELKKFFNAVNAPTLFVDKNYLSRFSLSKPVWSAVRLKRPEVPAERAATNLNLEEVEQLIIACRPVLSRAFQEHRLICADTLDTFVKNDELISVSDDARTKMEAFKAAFLAGERVGVIWCLNLSPDQCVGLNPGVDYSRHIIFVGLRRSDVEGDIYIADSANTGANHGNLELLDQHRYLDSLLDYLEGTSKPEPVEIEDPPQEDL